MNQTVMIVLGVGIVAVVLLAVLGPRLKKFSFRAPGASLEAEGHAPPAGPRGGITLDGAKAGRDIRAHSEVGGDVSAKNAEAKQDLIATSTLPPQAHRSKT